MNVNTCSYCLPPTNRIRVGIRSVFQFLNSIFKYWLAIVSVEHVSRFGRKWKNLEINSDLFYDPFIGLAFYDMNCVRVMTANSWLNTIKSTIHDESRVCNKTRFGNINNKVNKSIECWSISNRKVRFRFMFQQNIAYVLLYNSNFEGTWFTDFC